MERCRIWWPRGRGRGRGRLQHEPVTGPARLVLLGWLFSRAGSVDVVVAAAIPLEEILRSFPTLEALQTIILSSNKRMPARLQEYAAFTILGDYVRLPREFEVFHSKQNHQSFGDQSVQKEHFGANQNNSIVLSGSLESGDQDRSNGNNKWEYDCSILDGFLDACKKSVVKRGNWVHFCCNSSKILKCDLNQVPVLNHLYLDDQKFEISHCHVILYDVPTAGRNHFSLGEDAACRLKSSIKKPNWISNLEQKPLVFNLDPIVLALNCSNAARLSIAQEAATSTSVVLFSLHLLVQVTWHCVGIFFASVSTIIYIFIQVFQKYIQTVTSLWRLFRGRKWNPLRQRLDSYDYTVEQHVVGSLLFTPVLLLLPTTSIFYIFFSILSTTIICLCILLEITVSIIHSTPYAELIMWVARRQRFPIGLFFHPVVLSSVSALDGDGLLSIKGCRKTEHLHGQSEPLVSELRCNYATFGQIIGQNYQNIFNGAASSFCKQLAYGILSGERIPTTLHLQFSRLPWMHVGMRDYWMLCHGSILSCAPKRCQKFLS
ncbi:hypothetical protein GUJ93_ZPchr0010g10445 [Zizania palustris]|uniref:Uncharacterized protein n=1 Tax=Zizania palustris TaxID=103762 RepID=A0A8J6BD89_ZIZPA|nr:hypothetical protein GUJ93_ZPchr0010g10445 [Zizania palustris]